MRLTQSDLPRVRQELLEKQQQKCAICEMDLSGEEGNVCR